MTEKFKGWVSTEFLTWNPKTMGSVYLELSSVDESEGDVMGWRFVSHKGYNLIIVND